MKRICPVSWIIAHSAGFPSCLYSPPFQSKWPLCRLKEQSRRTKYFWNPLEYTEMCRLFRGEDYPTVYGTNTIPKFFLGRLVAYCPTVKTSASFRNNFAPHLPEWNKKRICGNLLQSRLFSVPFQKIKRSNLIISHFGFRISYIIFYPLVLKGTLCVPDVGQDWHSLQVPWPHTVALKVYPGQHQYSFIQRWTD